MQMKKEMQEQKVAAKEAEIDAICKTMANKYPQADEEAVIARAQYIADQGKELTPQIWEALWKSVHDRYKGRVDNQQSSRFKEQKKLNSAGKDVPIGGGTPGAKPNLPKTIKEASNLARREFETT